MYSQLEKGKGGAEFVFERVSNGTVYDKTQTGLNKTEQASLPAAQIVTRIATCAEE